MKIRIRSIAIELVLCLALGVTLGMSGACGGDKSTGDDDDDDQGEKIDKDGLGEGAMFVDAGNAAMTPVKCGKATCKAQDGDTPCCYDSNTDFCGAKKASASACLAVSDPRCPSIRTDGGVLASCCRSDGMCGVDFVFFGMGCLSLSDPLFRNASSNPPEPRRCDAADAGD
jgi:hypothetical protein